MVVLLPQSWLSSLDDEVNVRGFLLIVEHIGTTKLALVMRGDVSILCYFPRVRFVSPFLKSSYNSLLPLFCNHKNLPYSFKDIYLEKQEGFPNKGFKQLIRGCCLFSQCRNAACISKNL